MLARNPDLRRTARRVDLKSVAMVAVTVAARTFDPKKSQPTTYFGSAIRHALYKEVLAQQKRDGRYVSVAEVFDSGKRPSQAMQRALRAIRMLSAYDRTLPEDRLVEQITLEQLGEEQQCDPRTIKRRVSEAIERLKAAESRLP